VREHLCPGDNKSRAQLKRDSARVGRQIKRLHLRGLVAKIPRSRRWRVTDVGYKLMAAAIRLHEQGFPDALARAA
jgi:predicted transcriptional regulator